MDGNDMDAFLAAFENARRPRSGKPQLIIAKTLIGKGIPEVAGTQRRTAKAARSSSRPRARTSGCLKASTTSSRRRRKTFFAEHKQQLIAALRRVEARPTKRGVRLTPTLAKELDDAQNRRVPSTEELLGQDPGVPG